MKTESKRLSFSVIVAALALTAFPGLLWAPREIPSGQSANLRACYNLLNSGAFQIHEIIGNGVAIRVLNALTNKVMDLLQSSEEQNPDRSASKAFEENLSDFDQLMATITRREVSHDWSLDPKSSAALDDCHAAAHENQK